MRHDSLPDLHSKNQEVLSSKLDPIEKKTSTGKPGNKCKVCCREYNEILHFEQCTLCKSHVCRFCSFKTSRMYRNGKGTTKTSTKMNFKVRRHICSNCYDSYFQGENPDARYLKRSSFCESSPISSSDFSKRKDSDDVADVLNENINTGNGLKESLMKSDLSIWLSFYSATSIFINLLTGQLPVTYRILLILSTYLLLINFHPIVHPVKILDTLMGTTNSFALSEEKCESDDDQEDDEEVTNYEISEEIPKKYNSTIEKLCLLTSKYTSSDGVSWVTVKSNKKYTVLQHDVSDGRPPVLRVDGFVPHVTADDFLNFLNGKTVKDRKVWDINLAKCKNIEQYKGFSVDHNTQKPFLGGWVSARDFCAATHRMKDSLCAMSIEHPLVSEVGKVTRGTLHFSCFNCTTSEKNGEAGIFLKYICHVDINGNIPRKLFVNGTIDTMTDMMLQFQKKNKTLIENYKKRVT